MISTYVAFNRKGEACLPHRYPDGHFRAARYVAGDKDWKADRNYIVVREEDLPSVTADPELYLRMSPEHDPVRPSFFPSGSIRIRRS